MMRSRVGAIGLTFFVPLLLIATASSVGLSSASSVPELMQKTGLSYAPVKERTDTWFLTYTGLANLDELKVYVWARKTNYVSIYATAFRLDDEPSRAFLWRLLELNNSMLPFKFVIRDDPEQNNAYLVDCQADLPFKSLDASELRANIGNLVSMIDDNYMELNNLL